MYQYSLKLTTFLLLIVMLSACQTETTKVFDTVTITPVFLEDSLNIRALAPLDENRVWFAANNGKIGLIDNDIPKLAVIKYEDRLLQFRSIAKTPEAVMVLSVASPAVLYKIGFDGTEATNIENVYTEVGEEVFYDSMKFWNDKEGIAIGDPMNGCMAIIITRDGGNTWAKIPCESLPSMEKGEVAFAASNSNIAVYGDYAWVATGGKKSRVFYTADKGITWQVQETPIVKGGPMTGIFTIDFADENTGVIFGGDWKQKEINENNKAYTVDGGKTWQLIADGEGPGYSSSVKFVPGTDGLGLVAVGPVDGIHASHDAGKTWKKLSEQNFYAIEFVNDSIAFASGNGNISKLVFKFEK